MTTEILICLIILTSQCVHSKVIIVNSDNGNDSTECCVNGTCTCSSLSTALLNIDNNTIINITSESVALNNTATMGSGKLTNITITGNNVTIMCNNSGSVYCESCDDVMIEGITWDRCGDPNGTNIAGVTFNGTSNISLVNCTFQNCQITAVSLLQVLDGILIQGSNFLSNIPMKMDDLGVLNISRVSAQKLSNNSNITIIINNSYFYNNTNEGARSLYIYIDDTSVAYCNIIFKRTKFISNQVTFALFVTISKIINIHLTELSLLNNYLGLGAIIQLSSATDDVWLWIISSHFHGNNGSNVFCSIIGNKISVMMNTSNFTGSKTTAFKLDKEIFTLYISTSARNISEIMFYRAQFNNNVIPIPSAAANTDITGTVLIVAPRGDIKINMSMVNFTYNQNFGRSGGALAVSLPFKNGSYHRIFITGCRFIINKSSGHGAAMYINTQNDYDDIQITNTIFEQNVGGYSVVYLNGFLHPFIRNFPVNYNLPMIINSSTFANNTGSSLYLSSCHVKLSGTLLFSNNTAENGGAIYVNQETIIYIDDEVAVKFFANKAKLNGGAIYVDMVCSYNNAGVYSIINTFVSDNSRDMNNLNVTFINNSARIAGNSLYVNIPRPYVISSSICMINTNISDPHSILFIPCKLNYSQSVNGKMMNIPCYLDYILLNGTGAPIVTSPRELRLYFPFNDGYNISSTSDHNVYFVRSNILGHEVKFTGAVFDYFGKLTEPTQFSIQLQCLQNTECSAFALMSDNHNYILTQSIDNLSVLTINFRGKRIYNSHINLNVTLTSLLYSLNDITATLVVELVPCIDHPGYTYSEESQTCVCYHQNINCYTDSSEIQRGYWFGSIASKATTSLCPNHYCSFTDRKETSEGYFELPNTINAQCNNHRVGRACGECSSGYTLSYDSTDCISVDQCGTGWTVLVITLTCLYWIAVVVGVFSLMYFRSKISLGYLYGLIYYYSMVGILLNNKCISF